jgi:hypothetical protein
MKNVHSTLWSIDELRAEVARALSVGYAGAASGRVRDVPDLRTIRYYTTLCLIDRPAEMNQYNGPGTAVKKVIEDEYRNMLKGAGTVESFPRHDFVTGTAGAIYVGAETCKQCHPNTYAKW